MFHSHLFIKDCIKRSTSLSTTCIVVAFILYIQDTSILPEISCIYSVAMSRMLQSTPLLTVDAKGL